jgi:hypothetical protein
MDVGLGGERSEEGDAAALRKGGEVGGELADDEGGFGVGGGGDGAEAGADFVAEGLLGAHEGKKEKGKRQGAGEGFALRTEEGKAESDGITERRNFFFGKRQGKVSHGDH